MSDTKKKSNHGENDLSDFRADLSFFSYHIPKYTYLEVKVDDFPMFRIDY